MVSDERDNVVNVCGELLLGENTMARCLSKVIDTIGWRWGFVIFSYSWLAFLTVVQGTLIRLCCGKLRPVEQGLAMAAVLGKMWRSFLFVVVVLAPKDVREWLFWVLWFSSTGLLMLLETVGKQHFEHVVENPRFGVGHTLRILCLHALVLFLGVHLARVGWNEFFEWGEGPIGQVLLSPMLPTSADVSGGYPSGDDSSGGGGSYFGATSASSSVSTDPETDPERGGTGFALLLLYDLAVTGMEVGLSALKYFTNLLELHKDPDSAYTEESSMEQATFFTRLGQAILSASRAIYMFNSCGHCALPRKLCVRVITLFSGGQTLKRIHRAAWRVVLAREMDLAFPDASEKELKNMAADESCAICLKAMTSAKRLQCHHFFHPGCLRQYLNNKAGTEPLCPICRAPISWHPSVGGIKPHLYRHQAGIGESDLARAPMGREGQAPNNNDGDGDDDDDDADADRNTLTFGPAVNRPPTPDGFSRAARGADSVVRVVRQILRFGLTGGGGGGGRVVGVGVAVGGGRTRGVAPHSTAAEQRRRNGTAGAEMIATGGGGHVHVVAQQVLDIFPSIGWRAALSAARLANGSTELAVEYALRDLSNLRGDQQSERGTSPPSPPPRDDPIIGVPSLSEQRPQGVGSGGVTEGNRAGGTLRRRWWE